MDGMRCFQVCRRGGKMWSIGRNSGCKCIQRWVPQLAHPSTGAGGNRKKHARSHSWGGYTLRVLREDPWLLWKGVCFREPSPASWASSTRSAVIWIPKASNVFETQRTTLPRLFEDVQNTHPLDTWNQMLLIKGKSKRAGTHRCSSN